MSAIALIYWVPVVLGLIDAIRHTNSDWQYADRNKAFWIIFMVFPGPPVVLLYLFAVRPRFPKGEAPAVSSQFLK